MAKAKKRQIGGNTKKVNTSPGARMLIRDQQKAGLRAYKYDLQASVRKSISGPQSGAVASSGSQSSFKVTPRNTAGTKLQAKKPDKALSGGVKKIRKVTKRRLK